MAGFGPDFRLREVRALLYRLKKVAEVSLGRKIMKTAIVSTNPAIKLPPLSAVLLLLSFFLSIAAWRAMDINQDLIPHRPY